MRITGKDDRWAQVDLTSATIHFSDGSQSTLRPKPAEVLAYLARHPNELVTKEELFASVWEKEVVVEGALRNAIAEVRKALKFLGVPVIKAIPKKGYVLILPNDDQQPAPIKTDHAWTKLALCVLFGATLGAGGSVLLHRANDVPTTTSPPTTDTDGCELLLGQQYQAAGDYSALAPPDFANPSTGDFSVSVWLILDDSSNGVILDQREWSGDKVTGWALALADRDYETRIVFQMASQERPPHNFPAYSSLVVDGRWHNITVTVDRDDDAGGMIFFDGEPDGPFMPTKHASSLRTNAKLWIGSQADGIEPFSGRLAKLEFFDRALSKTEVLQRFRETSTRECLPAG